MALQLPSTAKAFPRVLRGYDPEDVDEHLEVVAQYERNLADALDEAEAANTRLTDEVDGLRRRVVELESSIRAESPRSIEALGERLTLVLGEAEAAARESVEHARLEAAALLGDAAADAAGLTERAGEALAAAERQAAETVALAELRAAETVGEADARAAEVTTEADRYAAEVTAGADRYAAEVTAEADRVTAEVTGAAERRAAVVVADTERWARQRRVEVEGWVEEMRAHLDAERTREAEAHGRLLAGRLADLEALDERRTTVLDDLDQLAVAVLAAVGAARTGPAGDPHGTDGTAAPDDSRRFPDTTVSAPVLFDGGDEAMTGAVTAATDEPGATTTDVGVAVGADGARADATTVIDLEAVSTSGAPSQTAG